MAVQEPKGKKDQDSNEKLLHLTLDELWYCHSVCKHEHPNMDNWRFPPASMKLNSELSNAILFCEENKETNYFLSVTLGDLLVLDYQVRADAKTAAGILIGKNILKKVFKVRNSFEFPGGEPEEVEYLKQEIEITEEL